MRPLRFFSRVAFICNICFLVVLVASNRRWLNSLPDNEIISDMIVLGYLVSAVLNLLVNSALILLLLIGRLRRAGVPVWLLIVNFVFFIVQILLLIANRHLK
ncbi:MAG TPA: hypothetical protein VGQ51_09860 [Puia sp.]|nr:hypothetical protein [Puia sp.]